MKKDEKRAEIKPTDEELSKMAKGSGQIVIAPKPEIEEYQRASQSVETMIMTAIKQKVDPATMERFLAMRKELKAEYAKEQFDRAMANFQAECPIIKRVKDGSKTKAGQVAFKYAPLEVILEVTKPILAKNGLTYNFKPVKNDAGKVTDIRCYAYHVAGHSDYSEMAIGDGGGTPLMSGEQLAAAKLTFAKRYAFNNIFGIVTEEEDNEQALQKPPVGKATEDQINDAMGKLDKCSTVEELTETWRSLSKEQKANTDLIIHANMIKSNIEDAKSKGL